MLASILEHCQQVTIEDRSHFAKPEWLEKYGRYSILIDGRRVATGNDLVQLISEVELLLRARDEIEFLHIGKE